MVCSFVVLVETVTLQASLTLLVMHALLVDVLVSWREKIKMKWMDGRIEEEEEGIKYKI